MSLKRVFLSVASVLCLVALVQAAGGGGGGEAEVHDPDVLKLTTSTFDSVVNGEDIMLVEFYAPWCGHCKHLAPEYAKAATTLLSYDPPIKLAKVDATAENSLASRFEVRSYPTLKVFRNGKDYPYNGPRETDGIVSYMKKQVGPAAKAVNSVADIDKYFTDRFAVLGLFSSDKSQLHSAFTTAANKLRDDYTFLKSSAADVYEKYGVPANTDAVIALKNYDDEIVKHEGKPHTKALEDFITLHSFPLLGEFNDKTSAQYQKRGLPVAKLYTGVNLSSKSGQYYTNRLKPLATEFQDRILFAVADPAKYRKEMEELGIADKKDAMAIEMGRNKYVLNDKFSTEAIQAWVESYLDGTAERYIKSEPIPEPNEDLVKVVVGKTFEDIVLDPSKDVLIEFYAPWCGHCKKLEPIYKQLAEKLQDVPTVVIAKMDATANDYPPGFDIGGFPTIMFVPAKKNARPLKYEGARELDDFVSFIKKNAVHPVKLNKKKKKKAAAEEL